jgi:hypothetical protein
MTSQKNLFFLLCITQPFVCAGSESQPLLAVNSPAHQPIPHDDAPLLEAGRVDLETMHELKNCGPSNAEWKKGEAIFCGTSVPSRTLGYISAGSLIGFTGFWVAYWATLTHCIITGDQASNYDYCQNTTPVRSLDILWKYSIGTYFASSVLHLAARAWENYKK